jgi:hypothetical protein
MIDLVAGYARGYSADQIRPFLKSLRETGYDGKILLFVNDGAAEEAKKWNVDIRPITKPRIKVHSARFICLEEELQKIDCEGVFLSDTRDVIFQKNPSEYLPSQGLFAYEEDQSMSLGTCPYNSLWIKLGYGEEVLEQLKTYPISCVGTTCGDRDSILVYLKKLRKEIEKIQPKTSHPQDQAAHNYIIRKDIICELKVWKATRIFHNEEGEVYTVGYISRGSVKIKDNKIINQSGIVPTVIHQWDRHLNLKNLVGCTL